MFLTSLLLKKAKSKFSLIVMESTVSGHKYVTLKQRAEDKKELIKFDPYVRMEVVYREFKKLRGFRSGKV